MRILENGDVGVLDEHGIRKEGRVASGRVHVWAGRAVAPSVLRERLAIAQEGVALVVVSLDAAGYLVGEPWIETRGVLDAEAAPGLLAGARREASDAVKRFRAGGPIARTKGGRRSSPSPRGSRSGGPLGGRWGSSR